MSRVQQFADKVGGHAYRPWKLESFDFDLAMSRNQRWIDDQIRQGRTIIDIGPDFNRRSIGSPPSPFYNMERSRLDGYEGYIKAFIRTGRNSGGVPGLDF